MRVRMGERLRMTAVRRLGRGVVLRGAWGGRVGVGWVVAATSVAVARPRPRRRMGLPVLSRDAIWQKDGDGTADGTGHPKWMTRGGRRLRLATYRQSRQFTIHHGTESRLEFVSRREHGEDTC